MPLHVKWNRTKMEAMKKIDSISDYFLITVFRKSQQIFDELKCSDWTMSNQTEAIRSWKAPGSKSDMSVRNVKGVSILHSYYLQSVLLVTQSARAPWFPALIKNGCNFIQRVLYKDIF